MNPPIDDEELRRQISALNISIATLTTTDSFRAERIENVAESMDALRREFQCLQHEIGSIKKAISEVEKDIAKILAGSYVLYVTLVAIGGVAGFLISLVVRWIK